MQGAPSLNQQSRGLGLAGQVLRYLATGNGILTYAASLVAASVKVLPESATPDVQALFAHGSYAPGASRVLDTMPGMTCGMWQMRPLSRGYVEARSPRPEEQPNINPRYFSDETDCRAAVGGLRWIRRLFAAPALAKYVVAETVPGQGRAERRRTAALREADRRHRVPRDVHLQDGPRHAGGRR